jgi:hypothetical protein
MVAVVVDTVFDEGYDDDDDDDRFKIRIVIAKIAINDTTK